MNTALFANPAIAQAYGTDPRLGYAQALLQNGSSMAPVQSAGEAFARALQAPLGGFLASRIRGGYQAQDAAYRNALAAALKGDDPLAALSQSSDPTLQAEGLQQQLALAQSKAKSKIELQNALAAKGLAMDPSGNIVPLPGYGSATGAISNEQNMAQIPGKVAEGQAMIPVNAAGAAANASATAPIQTAQALAQQQALMPGAVQQAGEVEQAQQAANPTLVTLVAPDGSAKTLTKSDPQVKQLIAQGYVERSGADPNSKPFTEDQSKAAQLLTEIVPDIGIAQKNYDALQSTMGQLVNGGPQALTNFVSSPEYQQAKNAIAHIIQNNLYSLSGAQITPTEAAARASLLMPTLGESAASIADKKARIQSLVDGMKKRAGPAAAKIDFPASVPPAPTGMPEFTDPNDPKLKALPKGSAFFAVDPNTGAKTLRYVP